MFGYRTKKDSIEVTIKINRKNENENHSAAIWVQPHFTNIIQFGEERKNRYNKRRKKKILQHQTNDCSASYQK
jgi:hypothetical protein